MKIELKNVTKTYDKVVLKDISLKIEGKSSIGIIGKSGCGKSTLLRLLANIEQPNTGEIKVNDLLLRSDNKQDYQKQIGFVFQSHNLFPHLTIQENITLILEKTRGIKHSEAVETAQKMLTKLGLAEEMDKLPKHISGGQSQRASIARSLAINPKIIFLDEPTASLDPVLTYEVLEYVKDLRESGKDFVFVTHELNFVRQFADYVVFMDDGNIVEHGDVSILDNPSSIELKEYLEKVL